MTWPQLWRFSLPTAAGAVLGVGLAQLLVTLYPWARGNAPLGMALGLGVTLLGYLAGLAWVRHYDRRTR